MAYVGIFFAMLAVSLISAVVLAVFVDALLHLMIFFGPNHLREMRKTGFHLEKHEDPWTTRLARELRLLLDPREHVGTGAH
jgi:hypothetical protein